MTSQMTTIGQVLSPFGKFGEVKVFPYSDFLDRYRLLKEVKLEGEGFEEFKVIKNAYIHRNLWVFHFEDCNTRDDASKLLGLTVKIFSKDRVKLPPGEYYLDQIIGLEALTVEGEKLGTVKDIIKTGSNDVYVIRQEANENEATKKKDILVPALKTVVKKISLKKGYIKLDLPLGLDD
ncbi:MAG: ribosome maturation factor RimM [Bacillota bacterium]|nr:ribosome maturation factor RimM [Bacillota bacterium]